MEAKVCNTFIIRSEIRFEPSMLGEVDKAIWWVDHLINYCKSALYFFLLPAGISFCGVMFYRGEYLFGIGYLLFCAAIEVALRLEMRKLHLPKKQDLQALRELIIAEN